MAWMTAKSSADAAKEQKDEGMTAYMRKEQREQIKGDPVLEKIAESMLEIGKALAKELEAHPEVTPVAKKKDGTTYHPSIEVRIDQYQDKNGDDRISPKLIIPTTGNDIEIRANQNGQALMDISVKTWQGQKPVRTQRDDIQSSKVVWKAVKPIVAFIEENGYLASDELKEFIKNAAAHIKENGSQIARADGSQVNEAYVRMGHDYQGKPLISVQMPKETGSEVRFELGEFKNDEGQTRTYARAIDFANRTEDGKPTVTHIKSIQDIQQFEGRVPEVATDILTAYKEPSPVQELVYRLNDAFKEMPKDRESANDPGVMVRNAYAQLDASDYGEQAIIRNHDNDIVITMWIDEKGIAAKAIDFNEQAKEENGGTYPSTFINKAEDLGFLESQGVPVEILDAVAKEKGIEPPEQEKAKPKHKEELDR